MFSKSSPCIHTARNYHLPEAAGRHWHALWRARAESYHHFGGAKKRTHPNEGRSTSWHVRAAQQPHFTGLLTPMPHNHPRCPVTTAKGFNYNNTGSDAFFNGQVVEGGASRVHMGRRQGEVAPAAGERSRTQSCTAAFATAAACSAGQTPARSCTTRSTETQAFSVF